MPAVEERDNGKGFVKEVCKIKTFGGQILIYMMRLSSTFH